LTSPPRGGHFSVSLVCLVRDLVRSTGTSLRCLASTLALLVERWDLPFTTPSCSTMRSWLLRLGCYALCCPLPQDLPWVWLIDHTVQLGAEKLFVILGCPLPDVPFGERALCLADLRLLALVPMASSTHEQVAAALEKASVRTGVPRLVVSDHGTDVKKGIEVFQQRHPTTVQVHDVVHYGANVLENRWQREPRWQEFLRQLQQTNQKLRQTAAAYLLAPTLRPKARFMNVGPLLRFAQRVLRLLECSSCSPRVVEKYDWLRGYGEALAGWLEDHRLVQTTIERVRRHGLDANTLSAVEASWGELSTRPGTAMVAGYMRVYARRNGGRAAPGETLVGSTEALESSFGKLKRLEGDAKTGGFTGLVLALGALTGSATEAETRAALEAVPNKEAEGWVKRTLGATMCWLRRQIFGQKKG
jgi:hypothetical protein